MLEAINSFNLFRNNYCDWDSLDEEQAEAVAKTFKDLVAFSNGSSDPVGLGEVYFKNENTTKEVFRYMRYNDYLNKYNVGIKVDSDNDLRRWEEWLREGCAEYNKRVIIKLTKDLGIKKQAENYTKSCIARQKHATFKCEACEVPCYTNSPSVYQAHLNTKSHIIATDGDPALYTCRGCGTEFENTKAKLKHEESRKCIELRTCNDCGSRLSSKQRYEEHFIHGICNSKLKELIASGKLC